VGRKERHLSDAHTFLDIACLLKIMETIQGFLTEVKKERSYAILWLDVHYWSQTEASFREKSSLKKLRQMSFISYNAFHGLYR